jgi:hypothetical protein
MSVGPFLMTRAQRIVLIVYRLLLAYCCTWIPWRVTLVSETQSSVGNESTNPYQGEKVVYSQSVYSFVWNAPSGNRRWIPTPAIDLILLRIVAVSAISGAAFFLVGLWKSATRN